MSELRAIAGRPIYIEATLVRDATPVDTTAGGFKAWFTLKESREDLDADAVSAKTEADGIAVNTPADADLNIVTVTLPAAETADYVEAQDLYWELVIDDPASARGVETIDYGILKLGAPLLRVVQ